MVRRSLGAVTCAWLPVVGVTRFVALPERCPPVDAADTRAAATEAVGWFARNQEPDGRWIYRYDRAADAVDHRVHVVVDGVRRPDVVLPAGPGGGALVPLAVPALVRPAVALLAVATTAAGGVAAGAVVAGAVAAAGASTRLHAPRSVGGGGSGRTLGEVAR